MTEGFQHTCVNGIDRGLFRKVDRNSKENGGDLKRDAFGINQGIHIQGIIQDIPRGKNSNLLLWGVNNYPGMSAVVWWGGAT